MVARNPPTETPYDVSVVGAGPSGTALAAALAAEGLSVALVGPAGAWTNTLCFWPDEVEDAELLSCAAQRWPDLRVHLEDEAIVLQRPYACFDNALLRELLSERCRRAGVTCLAEEVAEVSHDAEGSDVDLRDGRALRARLVVDATGHAARFVRRAAGGPSTFQTAYGILADIEGQMVGPLWMDFRDVHLGGDDAGVPTFLYALPMSEGRWLLEETSLVRGPAVSMDVLRARLERRLTHLGVRVVRVHEEERCVIPMDAPLPVSGQRIVGFGGAASMVHPASGFMVASALGAAPGLAHVLASALRRGDPPDVVARAAWSHLWPADRVRARNLQLFGGNALAGMDAMQTRRFFAAFFALPTDQWRSFLRGDAASADVAAIMLRLFRDAPMPVRWSLVSAGAPAGVVPLLRAVLGA